MWLKGLRLQPCLNVLSTPTLDRLVNLEDFDAFAHQYRRFILKECNFEKRREIVKKFVSRVEVGADAIKIHFIMDKEHYRHELALKKAGSSGFSSDSNFLISDGSNTLTFGARQPMLDELLSWVETYPIQWREPRFDLAELARLRWVQGWSRPQLAEHFGKSPGKITNHLQKLRRKNFRVDGLSAKEAVALKRLSQQGR